jgi:hypothetical protein
MAYTQLSRTTPVIEAWQDITDEQNDAQTVAIYDVIGKHGGKVLSVGFSPTQANLVSVIEYPDELSAQKSVAGILALRTLDFQSIESLGSPSSARPTRPAERRVLAGGARSFASQRAAKSAWTLRVEGIAVARDGGRGYLEA